MMKRFVAFCVAGILALTPVTAFATQPTVGEGSIPTVLWGTNENTVFRASTAANFNFVLDPQGLYGLTDGDIEALDPHPTQNRLGIIVDTTWQPLENAGQIIFANDGEGGHYVNESTHAQAVTLGLRLTSAGTSHETAVTTVGTPGEVDGTAGDVNLFIGATFSRDNVIASVTADEFFGEVTLPITRVAQAPLFILDEADYTDSVTVTGSGPDRVISVTRDANLVADTGNGTQFMLEGALNSAANWSALLPSGPDGETPAEVTIGLELIVTAREATEHDLTAVPVEVDAKEAHGLSFVAEGLEATTHPEIGLEAGAFIIRAMGSDRDPDQQAAFEATRAATGARTTAIQALTPLNFAYEQFDGSDKGASAIEALETAIGIANEALGKAQNALIDAESALDDAVSLDDSDVNRIGLATAVGQLQEAVTALSTRIGEVSSVLRDPDEQAAFDAASDATKAAGDAIGAISPLHDAIGVFESVVGTPSGTDEDTLKGAIGDAEAVLDEAETALGDAKTALSVAAGKLDALHPDRVALENAIDALEKAIADLEAKIAEANALLTTPLTAGFIVDGEFSLTTTLPLPLAGTWATVPFSAEGGDLTLVTYTRPGEWDDAELTILEHWNYDPAVFPNILGLIFTGPVVGDIIRVTVDGEVFTLTLVAA